MDKNKKTKKARLPATLRLRCSVRQGFSLVELLVVLAIVVIMTGVLLVRQSGNRSREDVEAAARKVAAQLRSLQNEALNGKQINGVAACEFKFDAAADDDEYAVSYIRCQSPPQEISNQSVDINAKKNVKTDDAAAVSVTFTSPRGETAAAANQVILISKKDENVKASVCVCGSGNIFERSDAAACGC